MDTLIAGYRRFRANGWPSRRRMFESLAEDGQRPNTLVVACVDSRVDPTMIFDAAPGELLVVRNVANLVPPYAPDAAYHGTSAALEFGVRVLEVCQLIVLGHGMCGGVQALLNGAPEGARDFVAPWMSMAAPARAAALRCDAVSDRQRICEHGTIEVSLSNLMTFPWIAERVADGRLTLVGAWFAIHTGELTIRRAVGVFEPVSD